jgi:hypothetical protein
MSYDSCKMEERQSITLAARWWQNVCTYNVGLSAASSKDTLITRMSVYTVDAYVPFPHEVSLRIQKFHS